MTFVNISPPNQIGITVPWGTNPMELLAIPGYPFNGFLSMTGHTKDAGGSPHGRSVYLFLAPGMKKYGEQESDPSTGAFTWANLKLAPAGSRYCMVGLKSDGSVNGGVHDNVVPI